MHKNITISDLNVAIQGNGNNIKKHLVAKVGLGIIEFLLASVLHCYGIILSEYIIIDGQKYEDGMWASILFVCSWGLTEPSARFISEYFEDGKHRFFRYLIGCCATFLFFSTMIPGALIMYMVMGGILSCMVSTQLNTFAIDRLDMDSKVYEVIRQVTRALSLFLMPQLMFWLLTYYTMSQASLIFASILFNIIPAVLLIKTEKPKRQRVISDADMLRYQTIGRRTHRMTELKEIDKPPEPYQDTEQMTELKLIDKAPEPYQDSSSSSDDEEDEEPIFEIPQDNFTYQGMVNYGVSEEPSTYLKPISAQTYFLNLGVNILPGIPEEVDEEDINVIDPKRLSMISGKLEELNVQEQIRRDSIKEVFNINDVTIRNDFHPERINNIEYIADFKEDRPRISVLDEFKNFQKTHWCLCCRPYRKYIWARRVRVVKDFLYDNVFRPLYYAVKNLFFYPTLTTKVVNGPVSTLYITLAPFFAMHKDWKQNIVFTTGNVTFLLTYVAFAWCFFLVTLPLVLKLNHNRVRIVFVIGLITTGSSLWLLSTKPTNDVITISSLLFGFGHGIVSYTEQTVYKRSIGMRPWYIVRGALEVISALLILLVYHLMKMYGFSLNMVLFIAAMSYYGNAALWLCLPVVKFCVGVVKTSLIDRRSQQEGFFH